MALRESDPMVMLTGVILYLSLDLLVLVGLMIAQFWK